MTKQSELVQAAYDKWMQTLGEYRAEVQRLATGGTLDAELLRMLSDNAKRDSAAFSGAVKARANIDKKD